MKKRSMLIIAIILISIGFAAISTTLVINGNAKVSENTDDFSVIFTKARLDGKDVYSTVVDSTKKIINFSTSELKTLNQTSALSYEVTNNSSNYDAEVSVTCVPKEGTQAKYTSIKNTLENDATKVSAKSSVNGRLTITLDKTSTESVTEEYTCKLEFTAVERDSLGEKVIPEPASFETDSWETIQKAVQAGNTTLYNVGDTKEVDLGDLGTHTVRIANKSVCTTETSETACGFVVEFADVITFHTMNSTSTNVGGWPASEARTYINSTIYESLPSELQKVIVSTKVISGHGKTSGETNFTSIDKLYLLSTKEVLGEAAIYIYDSTSTINDTVDTETKQLDYYKNLGVTTNNYSGAKKIYDGYNGRNTDWWLRSARTVTDYSFMTIRDTGTWMGWDGDWDYNYANSNFVGISPAFRIA